MPRVLSIEDKKLNILTIAPKNKAGQPIIVGCNYHTTWQKHKGMRFVLKEVKGEKANMKTRQSGKDFWTSVEDLIFISTHYNADKALELLEDEEVPDELWKESN